MKNKIRIYESEIKRATRRKLMERYIDEMGKEKLSTGTPLKDEELLDEVEQMNVYDQDEFNLHTAKPGTYAIKDKKDGTIRSITVNETIKPFKKFLNETEGKGCAETEKGCIRKNESGWVILNNKKGGVWRKCDSKKHCQEMLDAMHVK